MVAGYGKRGESVERLAVFPLAVEPGGGPEAGQIDVPDVLAVNIEDANDAVARLSGRRQEMVAHEVDALERLSSLGNQLDPMFRMRASGCRSQRACPAGRSCWS